MFFTALPVIFLAVLDKSLPGDVLEENPQLYKENRGKSFTPSKFSGWLLRAWLHSGICFFVPLYALDHPQYKDFGVWDIQAVIFQCNVFIASTCIFFEAKNVTFMFWFALFSGVGSYTFFIILLSIWNEFNPDLYGVIEIIATDYSCWLTCVIVIAMCLLIELAIRGLEKVNMAQVFREKVFILLYTSFSDNSDIVLSDAMCMCMCVCTAHPVD